MEWGGGAKVPYIILKKGGGGGLKAQTFMKHF